jgi:hypothetical protein
MSRSHIPAGDVDGATVNDNADYNYGDANYNRGMDGANYNHGVDGINKDVTGEKNEYSNGESSQGLPTYKVPSNVVDVKDAKPKKPFMTRVLHSFRRREDEIHLNSLGQQVPAGDAEKGAGGTGEPAGPISHDTSRLNRKLQGRHLQMIAIGGSIGTGLFIGSGSALATGGPAALMICFGTIGVMLFCVIHALGELAVLFPIAGTSVQLILFRFLFRLLYPFH